MGSRAGTVRSAKTDQATTELRNGIVLAEFIIADGPNARGYGGLAKEITVRLWNRLGWFAEYADPNGVAGETYAATAR